MDSGDQTQATLHAILLRIGNASAPSTVQPNKFSPMHSVILVNALLFCSLVVSLTAALLALLIKQWAMRTGSGIKDITSSRTRAREYYVRSRGINRFRLDHIITVVPMLLHVALLLFFIGLLVWIFSLNIPVFTVVLIMISIAFTIYMVLAIIPALSPDAPFYWPATVLFKVMVKGLASIRGYISGFFSLFASTPPTVNDRELEPVYIMAPEESSSSHISMADSNRRQDAALLFEFLEYAETTEEIELALGGLRRNFDSGPLQKHVPTSHQLMVCANKLEVLMSTCWDYKDEAMKEGVINPHSLTRAIQSVRFLEWLWQVPSPNVEKIVPKSTSILVDALTAVAVNESMFEETVLCAALLIKQEDLVMKSDASHDQFHSAIEVLDILRNAGPWSSGEAQRNRREEWTLYRWKHYQSIVSAYIWPLTLCIVQNYDPQQKNQHTTYKTVLKKAQEVLGASVGTHTKYDALTQQLRYQWTQLSPTHAAAQWVKTILIPLGWDARKRSDGSRYTTLGVTKEQRQAITGYAFDDGQPRYPDDSVEST